MMREYDLLPHQKKRKQGLRVEIDIFDLAKDLHEELDILGIICRLKNINQLGTISVTKKLKKNRYDYVMLQLYLHQIIRKNIQGRLHRTYNNCLRKSDLHSETSLSRDDINDVTLGDAIQLLVLAYNAGHFYNTFVSSKAVVMLASEEAAFRELIVHSSDDNRLQKVVDEVLQEKNYQRVHLLNSLLILDRCSRNKKAIKISRELICSYLEEDQLPESSSLKDLFELFRKVRTVGYVAYDLHVAELPFLLDIGNEKALLAFLDEYLAEYNNNDYANALMNSLSKLLSDAVYNDPSGTICTTRISMRMIKELRTRDAEANYYDFWEDPKSVLNRRFIQRKDYDSEYLKVTFPKEQRDKAEKIFINIDRLNNTRVGFYSRHTGEYTLVVAIKKSCANKGRIAFRVLKTVVRYMRMMDASSYDDNYILVIKFFLFYLFGGRPVSIDPVTDEEKCVITARGKYNRIVELKKLCNRGNEDQQHEVNAMITYLRKDTKNDMTIMVPGSTKVFGKEKKPYAEFDGIIVYPNRESRQVVFIEAKNTKRVPLKGKKELIEKMEKLGVPYKEDEVFVCGHDAYYGLTI